MAPMFVEPFQLFLPLRPEQQKICETRVIHLLPIVCVYAGFWSLFGICSLEKKPRGFMSNILQESLLEDFARKKELE